MPSSPREPVPTGGYDPAFFDHLAQVEDEHFWFRARNELIFDWTRRISSSLKPCEFVLEVGCGTGNVLRVLERACPNSTVIGMELWLEGLRYARTRTGAALVQGDIRNLPFSRPFDLVGMFDVLEHLSDDEETLRLVHRSLRPGGVLVLTVPAHQFLWSHFDEAAGHCRRYSSAALGGKLQSAGFEVKFLTEFMAILFPLMWSYRNLSRIMKKSASAKELANEEFRITPIVNPIMTKMLSLEAKWVSRGHSLPIGTSLLAMARKPA
ncbi:MAG TPA: class I SAM-dependent methyltransferase [Terriglobales bacterium]|nr:class I SAM-dependent methyltransferase [Terriglobales bacterium]